MRIIDVSTGHPVALRYWDGSKWASIPNGNDAPQARTVHPPAGKTRNIGGGCAIMNLTVDPPHAPGVLVAANIPVVVDVATPVFEFDIIFRGSAGATPAELIQAAVSVGDDTPVPVTFGGAPSTTIRNPGNGQAVTVRADPTPITAAAGETIRFYGYTGAPEGGVSTGDQHGYIPGKDSWYAYGPSFAAAWNGVRLSPSTPGAKPVVAGMYHGALQPRQLAHCRRQHYPLLPLPRTEMGRTCRRRMGEKRHWRRHPLICANNLRNSIRPRRKSCLDGA